MSKAPPARASTPKSPIPAVVSPATHVTVFTVFECSGSLAGGAEGVVFTLRGTWPPLIRTVKNTLPVWRVKRAGGESGDSPQFFSWLLSESLLALPLRPVV